jgi:hypothetical protein
MELNQHIRQRYPIGRDLLVQRTLLDRIGVDDARSSDAN